MRHLGLTTALLLALLPARANPAVPERALLGPSGLRAGPFKWHFFPLHVVSGQVKVTCGTGFVVEWFVQVGDYVTKGAPICETCPHDGTSVTCVAPSSGQVVAEQPLGPSDDILTNVPDGTIAVIQPSGKPRTLLPGDTCQPVKCDVGVTFGQFLVENGDVVHRGDVVALALTAEGRMDHCRAPVDGRLASQADHIQRGEDLSSVGQTVGCVVSSAEQNRAGKLHRAAAATAGKKHHTCRAVQQNAGSGHQEAGKGAKADSFAGGGATSGPGAAATHVSWRAHAAGDGGDGGHGGERSGDVNAGEPAAGKAHAGKAHAGSSAKGGANGQAANASAAAAAPAAPALRAAGGPEGGRKGAREAREPVSIRRRLPLASINRQTVDGKHLDPVSKEQAPLLAKYGGLHLIVWGLVGLATVSMLLLGAFMLCGRSQTRSLYMLMQDSREEVTKGLRVDFRDGNGSEKSFCFESQPLGIVFTKQAPIRVERFEFNSYAKDRGVQLGWALLRVGQEEVTGRHSLPDVERMLRSHVKTLAFWPLRVDFDTGNGAIKAFYFVKQPLGVEITRQAPFRIALFKPDSYAKTCGVELGWVIVRIGDAVVNQRTSFGVLSAYFESGLSHLPQEPKGLRMDFSDPGTGKERVFYFQRRPLGLVLTRYKPIRVQGFEFNSYAKERGVQAGWTITRIGDQAVPSGLSFEQVDRRILENSATLAVWPLRMDFDTGRGVRTFYFEKQPLGMELLNKLPIKVDTFKPDSYAKACGVQLGWVITRVGDHEVTRETKFEQVIECLVEGVCELPPADAQQVPGRQGGVQRGPRSSFC